MADLSSLVLGYFLHIYTQRVKFLFMMKIHHKGKEEVSAGSCQSIWPFLTGWYFSFTKMAEARTYVS